MTPMRLKSRAILAVGLVGAAGATWAGLALRGEPGAAREARAALKAGQLPVAAEALDRWLAIDPAAAEAHLLKGRIALERKQPALAADELRRSLEPGGPPPPGAVLLRALIAAAVGRSAEAEPELSRAFADPASPPDRLLDEALAKIRIEAFDFDAAGRVLDRWIAQFPRDPKPHLWRAEIHRRTGADAAAALDDYRAALRRDPTLVEARSRLAEELLQGHRPDEALAEYAQVLARQPDDASAHLGAAQSQAELGDDVAATRHLDRAAALDPANPAVPRAIAEVAARRGDWEAMLGALDRAITLDPFDLTTSYRRGVALANLGRSDEARAEQARSAQLRTDLAKLNEARSRLVADPHDRASQLQIARWMLAHAHPEDGVRWAEKVLREWPDDPEASRLLADHYRARGESGLANYYQIHAAPRN